MCPRKCTRRWWRAELAGQSLQQFLSVQLAEIAAKPTLDEMLADEMVEALAKVSPGDEAFFRSNADAYLKKLDGKIAEWQAQMKPFSGSRIITFHKSWSYFANWLGLVIVAQVEPLPGIAPTPSHTADLIQLCRQGNIKAIIVEPFYDMSAPEQIARSTAAKVLQLPTSVGGVDQAKDYISLMDYNISTLSAALK